MILVNDGSTDNSGKIAKNFTDKINQSESESNVIYLEHTNHGALYSRERGICAATGDYLLFMDSDDWWDDNLIEEVNKVIQGTNYDIVQFGYKFKDENGNATTDAGISKKAGTGTGSNIYRS